MKLRNGFISNSSSSSFIINLKDLNDEQINKIINHMDYADDYGLREEWLNDWDTWHIKIKGYIVEGYTNMDNFDMYEFIDKIKDQAISCGAELIEDEVKKIEKLDETEEVEESFSAATFGSILHYIMKLLYDGYKEKELNENNFDFKY